MFAKKSLGQNFLNSPRIIERIADAANIVPGEIVLEIGPGKGVLTEALLARKAKVIALEKDDRLIPILSERFKKEIADGQLTLIHGDVTDDFDAPKESYKLVANIPYYITGEILRKFLSGRHQPSIMVLMVQKEVATRIIARDGKESILSLSVKAYGIPELVMSVSRGNFFPIPNVDSAVIKISGITNPFADETQEKRFFDLLHAGFAHKRKKLSSNLAKILGKEKIAEIFSKNNIDANSRAEDMPKEFWTDLLFRR